MAYGCLTISARRHEDHRPKISWSSLFGFKGCNKPNLLMSHERMFDFFVPASALSVQDIITLEPKERRFPKWVFNYMIGDGCPFKAIPTTVVPPACIPTNLGSLPLAIKITGEPESVVIASLRTGIFLTVKQVQSIITAFKIEEPLPGSGSGKGGRVIKVDHCTALVTGLFPLASEQEKAFMITSLMVRKQVRPEDAPEYLLKLTSMLDTNEAQHFSHVRKAAIDELKVAAMRANIAKCKQGKHEDDDEAEEKTRGRKPKRGLEQDEPESSGASGSRSKAPRTGDESKDHEEKLQRLNIRAPPEFLKFFPLVSYCYFKWAPKNFRVTVEFVQKERILTFSYITFTFNCVIFFREQKSYLNQSQNLRYGFGPENPVPTVV